MGFKIDLFLDGILPREVEFRSEPCLKTAYFAVEISSDLPPNFYRLLSQGVNDSQTRITANTETMDSCSQAPSPVPVVKKTTKLIAHDENNECNIGDTVRIMETRPLSRRKRWRLVTILEKAK